MWKKDEANPSTPDASRSDDGLPRTDWRTQQMASSERATIGRSITIKGEVSGDEDLLIQGRVDGTVDLKQHAVTVGGEGRVNANITGRIVTVEGEVEGDLQAQEQVILRNSARVHGDIKAPRVVLEDGASFRGLVDMGDPGKPQTKSQASTGMSAAATTDTRKATDSGKPSDSSSEKVTTTDSKTST